MYRVSIYHIHHLANMVKPNTTLHNGAGNWPQQKEERGERGGHVGSDC